MDRLGIVVPCYNEEDVLKIRNLYDNNISISDINKIFSNLSKSTIRRIALRESYKNIK